MKICCNRMKFAVKEGKIHYEPDPMGVGAVWFGDTLLYQHTGFHTLSLKDLTYCPFCATKLEAEPDTIDMQAVQPKLTLVRAE